jgi:hypothetical protein
MDGEKESIHIRESLNYAWSESETGKFAQADVAWRNEIPVEIGVATGVTGPLNTRFPARHCRRPLRSAAGLHGVVSSGCRRVQITRRRRATVLCVWSNAKFDTRYRRTESVPGLRQGARSGRCATGVLCGPLRRYGAMRIKPAGACTQRSGRPAIERLVDDGLHDGRLEVIEQRTNRRLREEDADDILVRRNPEVRTV